MTSVDERRTAIERELRILRLDHFTVPVRDFDIGRAFYCDVLGGEVTKEPDWEPFRKGRTFGAHMAVQLFNADGHLVLYYQPYGQPAPDQLHPRRTLNVASADKLDEIVRRLGAADVPHVLATPSAATDGEAVPATAYFRDPDGNQLALTCDAYPFHSGVHVGAFDPWALAYPWARWRDRYAGDAAQARQASSVQKTERGYGAVSRRLDIEGPHNFTLPVRDVTKAEAFYSQVVGAQAIDSDADGASKIQVGPDVRVSLVPQRYGWQPTDVSNPHWAFEIAGDEVDEWIAHLESWGVPWTLVVRDEYVVEAGKPARTELHFLDPDGNQIEMVAWDYPMNGRAVTGHYNPWDLAYRHDQWPPV